MCGIAGMIDLEWKPVDAAPLGEMLRLTGHRGPDHRGTFSENNVAIGYNRLAILDLSPLGHQPMPNHDRTAWIVYNGEVYNYVELMKELRDLGHTFVSHSDTEVILAAYDEWGIDCLSRMNGMWAFAIWDRKRERLFCARDRFGVKPFYYARRGSVLYFASEIKALVRSGVVETRPRAESLYEFFSLGFTDTSEATCFEGIEQLPGSHAMEITREGVRRRRWWDLEPGQRVDPGEAPRRFKELFSSAVELRLRSDVPVGTCLSGGLDSSSIVESVTRIRDRVQTFSIYFEGNPYFDEREFIREVARNGKVDAHLLDPSSLVSPESFREATYFQEEPSSGASSLAGHFVMGLAKRSEMKVLLDGQGGDEVLGGYLHFIDPLFAARLKRFGFAGVARDLARLSREQGIPATKSGMRFAKVVLHSLFDLERLTRFESAMRGRFEQPFTPRMQQAGGALGFRYERRFGRPLDDVLYNALFVKSLPQLLRREDRSSMAFSIEVRLPFLDYRLVEFAFGLPEEWKIRGIETKRILREGLKDILPEKIQRRKDKRGFVAPGDVWLRGPLREFARETFRSERFEANGLLDAARVRRRFDDYLAGRSSRGGDIWRYLSYAVWLEEFFP